MDGLEKLTVDPSLVAEDFGEGLIVGQEAGKRELIDAFLQARGRMTSRWVFVQKGDVTADLHDRLDDDLSLVADASHETPGENGDAIGEEALEPAFRLDLFEDGVSEFLPVLLTLEKRNHWRDGEHAVLDGVVCNRRARGLDRRFQVGMGDRNFVVLHGDTVTKWAGDLEGANGSFRIVNSEW